MSKKSKSRDTSGQTAEEQRKTMSMMMDRMQEMRTPMDELQGMQQKMQNSQLGNFTDMFSQMMGGANQQMQNNPGMANFMQATGQQPPQQAQSPFMQMPQQAQDQMAAQQQPAQPQQPPQPSWMANMTPEQQAAISSFGNMGSMGGR